jgi:hypothetical protein
MGATAKMMDIREEMSCSHHIDDQDQAMISGLCPLCLKAERDKLRVALEAIVNRTPWSEDWMETAYRALEEK